ncbi:CesT family type III secretion system chaperone [Sansalvadorimonas sp. 2012CJ34-2]|uniref:CesT family type III secretion system chaperone n=1 Tax=Parendozoicomonas callyspongiae TaxID=2942213 RepID=A0ABT0PDC7_9GAMM|nr:CesT family type III secretion system chaperone [Sansalvadorimonas sp. 2012CJ34-2]MCL6269387.1 CesT family type III secretion system chaperone [Sansalvadorimonas sp. 2012CJ34-2]
MAPIELLKAWMTHAGLDKDALDKEGRVCSFIFNDIYPVSVEAPAYSDDLFLVVEITPLGTGEIRRKRLETAMQLNAYALETRGAVLGWDSVGERIILAYRVTAESSSAELVDNMISNLLDIAEQIHPALALEDDHKAQKQLDQGMDNMLRAIVP